MKTGKSKIIISLLVVGLVVLGALLFVQPRVITAGDEPQKQTGDAETILQKRLANAIVLYAESPIARVNNAQMQVEADNAGIVPYVSGGRVLVPLRFIAQNLQAEITWEKETSAVTLTVGKDTVKLQPGQEQMQINGKSVKLDAVPEIIDGRTFVPIRAISEAFGKAVFYDRGLIVIGDDQNPFDKESEKSLLDRLIAKVNNLPAVGSAENLLKLLTEANENDYRKRIAADGGIAFDMAATVTEALNGVSQQQNTQNKAKVPAPAEQKQGKTESSAAVDYSKTNVQVQGVDEADLVKTDGEYLYHVNKQRVLITKAYPAAELQVVSTLTFAEKDFWPEELYLDEQYLVVIGRNNLYYDYILKPVPVVPQDDVQPDKDKNTINNTATAGIAPDEAQAGGQDGAGAAVQFEREVALADVAPAVPRSAAKVISIWPPRLSRNEVKVFIFDIRDKTKITKVREVEIEGNYLTSRKIGSFVYFVANCPAYLYGYGQEENPNPVPFYRDTTLKNDYQAVPYEKIYYLPPVRSSNYLVIAGLDLNQREEGVQISTYLGAGDDVYVSQNNLYVALQNYNYGPIRIMALDAAGSSGAGSLKATGSTEPGTQIYKFSLDQGRVTYLAKGEVPGTLLNQFSMDEHKGYFRVATTTGNTWSSGQDKSQNNVYVLDETMTLVGMVEGIAPGERIYSTRFIGDRAYLVTFKDTDPFFVLDLKVPSNPRVLGALKIPGYSDYLHPYDENHIIGIGKDTVEVPIKGWGSAEGTVSTQAYYQGMKLAVFDVTDVTKPRELFKEVIGDRGTDSELLRDHKALLFDREKELFAFPVRVLEIPAEYKQGNPNAVQYGQFTFQGAYVYQLNLTDGFTLRGKITHLSAEELLKAGSSYANADKEIKRILYIDNVLYTLSDGMIKANGMTGLKELNSLALQ